MDEIEKKYLDSLAILIEQQRAELKELDKVLPELHRQLNSMIQRRDQVSRMFQHLCDEFDLKSHSI